jgi:transposase
MMQTVVGRENHFPERSSVLSGISVEAVYITCGYTDMRRSIDGLAAMVQQSFKLDPCSRSLFLFCGKRSDRIKGLLWEGDGFLLLYKRLESGRFQWPRHESEVRSITQRQVRWLLEGLSIEQPKALVETGVKRVI